MPDVFDGWVMGEVPLNDQNGQKLGVLLNRIDLPGASERSAIQPQQTPVLLSHQ